MTNNQCKINFDVLAGGLFLMKWWICWIKWPLTLMQWEEVKETCFHLMVGVKCKGLTSKSMCRLFPLNHIEWIFTISTDDSWLNISPEELETLLMKRSGVSNGSSPSADLGQVASGMKSFVDKVSGVDGAEFPGWVLIGVIWQFYNLSLIGEVLLNQCYFQRPCKWLLLFCREADEEGIQFDSAGFISAMTKMFGKSESFYDSITFLTIY